MLSGRGTRASHTRSPLPRCPAAFMWNEGSALLQRPEPYDGTACSGGVHPSQSGDERAAALSSQFSDVSERQRHERAHLHDMPHAGKLTYVIASSAKMARRSVVGWPCSSAMVRLAGGALR
jgi:hypothetical protein